MDDTYPWIIQLHYLNLPHFIPVTLSSGHHLNDNHNLMNSLQSFDLQKQYVCQYQGKRFWVLKMPIVVYSFDFWGDTWRYWVVRGFCKHSNVSQPFQHPLSRMSLICTFHLKKKTNNFYNRRFNSERTFLPASMHSICLHDDYDEFFLVNPVGLWNELYF